MRAEPPDHAVAGVPLQPAAGEPVEQHRRALVGRERRQPADDLLDGLVADPRALGPPDGDALRGEPARELERLGVAEDLGAAPGHHHRRRDGVEAQLAPGLREEVGDDVDLRAAPSSAASAAPAGSSGTLSCAGSRWRTRPGATPSEGHQTIAGSTVAGPASGATSASCSTPFCSTTTTVPGAASAASQRAAPAVWCVLTARRTQPRGRPPAGRACTGPASACSAPSGSSTTGAGPARPPAQRDGVAGALGGGRERRADRAGADDGDVGHARE